MRLGVIADLHANLHALDTALGKLRADGVDRIVCLGDLVGYGPRPNEVVERIAELDIPTVAGNHDLVAAGRDPLEMCGSTARPSLEWTRAELTRESQRFLAALPQKLAPADGVLAAHGSIDDPWHYVRRSADACAQLDRMSSERGEPTILLLGHTHRQMVVDASSAKVATSEGVWARRVRRLPFGRPLFVNPGAVGQPRELRPRVRFAVLDLSDDHALLHALPYDHERTERELRERELPTSWAHPRPTFKKALRQVLRDAQDRRSPRESRNVSPC